MQNKVRWLLYYKCEESNLQCILLLYFFSLILKFGIQIDYLLCILQDIYNPQHKYNDHN